MKRILITGGGGYVGSSLSDYLIEKDYEVSVYDLFIYGQNVFKNVEILLFLIIFRYYLFYN